MLKLIRIALIRALGGHYLDPKVADFYGSDGTPVERLR